MKKVKFDLLFLASIFLLYGSAASMILSYLIKGFYRRMLKQIREHSQSWFVRFFFALLVACFVILWGVGDVFNMWSRPSHVATVGRVKIGLQAYHEAIQQDLNHLRASVGENVTLRQAAQYGLFERALRRLAQQTLLDLEADRLGIIIPAQEVRDVIRQIKGFQDQSGKFSKDIFQATLQRNHLSEKQFVDRYRADLKRQHLLSALTQGALSPRLMVNPLFAWQFEKRVVDVATLAPADIKSIKAPTDEEIEKFYNASQERFRAPEYRDVSVLILKLDDIEKTVTLTDKEKAEGFKAHQTDLSGAPLKEERDTLLKELKQEKVNKTFQDLSAAIDDALAGGTSVEEVAKKHQLTVLKLSQLQQSGVFQGANPKKPVDKNMLKTIVHESFQMDASTEARLTEADARTFVAIHVDKISLSYVPPLAEIKSNVVKAWQDQERMKAAVKLASAVVEKVKKGGSFADAVKSAGLALTSGLTVSQEDPKAIPALLSPQAAQRIFEAKLKTAVMAPTSKGLVIAYINKTIPVSAETRKKQYGGFSARVTELLREDIAAQYIRALEARFPVEIHQRVLESYVQQVTTSEER